MKKSKSIPKVFFNASVIIAGLHSPNGGSGKLLSWVREKKINGVISETVLDEVEKHTDKTGLTKDLAMKMVLALFPQISTAPNKKYVEKYHYLVTDRGDSHVFASCETLKVSYLVSLDKKHILILTGKIRRLRIVSPKQLIESLSYQ